MDKQPNHIAEQAATYLAGSQSESLGHRRAREAWLAEDVQHRRAYDEMQQLWDHAGNLRDDPELKAFTARRLAAMRRSRSSTWLFLAAAALSALLGGTYFAAMRMATTPPARYATQLGERRTQMLADGTQVVLNTDTVIEVRYTRNQRSVELQHGEAQFDVAHDASRPFVVQVDGDTVTALGTRFQVRRNANAVVVTLLRGSVEVEQGLEHRILHPDEQARISPGTGIHVEAIDPAQATGWLEGWLHFSNATLGEVVAEANRYSARKLRLADPQLARLRLHGNFRTGDTASIAAAAGQLLPVKVDDRGADMVLRLK